jgi:hypothetical protein
MTPVQGGDNAGPQIAASKKFVIGLKREAAIRGRRFRRGVQCAHRVSSILWLWR